MRKAKRRKPATEPGAAMVRSMVTPEGVDLSLRIGSGGERAAAFLLDVCIMVLTLGIFSILVGLAAAGTRLAGLEAYVVIWLLGFFALRNAYFIAFELDGRAATPGKRLLGLRVAARNGGRLSAEAVFARNAMREIEVFLPIMVLSVGGGSGGGLAVLLGLLWTGVLALFPLFNRDRLRVGDFVAGTWVVKAPKARLLPDLSARLARPFSAPSRMAFTPQQLQAYGVKELYVLEDVLRAADAKVMAAVAKRIRAKIDWPQAPGETDPEFLDAYYAALRARLEHRLLFGHRRRDKFDKV